MEKKRSVGVILYGTFLILLSLISFTLMQLATPSTFVLKLLYSPILPLLIFISGLGILFAQKWSAYIMSFVCVIFVSFVMQEVALIAKTGHNLKFILTQLSNPFDIGILLFIFLTIYFFTRSKVKEQFQKGDPNA